MNTPLFIARRLRISARSGRSATGIVIAVTGTALAVAVMLLSIAVVKGFKHEIRGKVTAFESQIMVSNGDDTSEGDVEAATSVIPLALTDTLKEVIHSALPEADVTLSISLPGVLKTDTGFSGVFLKGNPHSSLTKLIGENIADGRMADFANSPNAVMLSATTAKRLGLKAGDRVSVYFFSEGSVKARKLNISGIFDTHFNDYDANMVIADASMLARVAGIPKDNGTRIDVNGIASDGQIEESARKLQSALLNAYYDGRLHDVYRVDNVHRRGALYFNWLEMLDTNVAVIIALMAAVAAFTLISSLFIIILERVNMIGILKALGASNAMIRKVFILVAERLVLRGLIAGNAAALLLIWLQSSLHFIPLDPDTYYLTYVPVSIGVTDVVWLNLAALAVSALVLILPSHIVATISPSRSIRYD